MSSPPTSGWTHEVSGSAFEPIVEGLAHSRRRPGIPLHQGHTAFTTQLAAEPDPERTGPPPYLDGPTGGLPMLLAAVRAKLERDLEVDIDPSRLQITNGITHALSVVWHCVLEPTDEVIVLSPHWLFADGLVRAARGVPREVPFFPVAGRTGHEDLAEVARHVTPRTRAIYFNSPNNPSGQRISAELLHGLAELARDRGLWLVADNAYEYYDFSADGFVDSAAAGPARELTFAAYSFSKSYGMTGYRIGYLLSPPAAAAAARKAALYSIYSVATSSQYAAASALRAGPEVIDEHRRFVAAGLRATVDDLAVPALAPAGGFYAFLDLSAWPGGPADFLACCLQAGVSLAPGSVFGAAYSSLARLCFSVVSLAELRAGLEIVNQTYLTRCAPSGPESRRSA
jgi:aspartate aminotransferase